MKELYQSNRFKRDYKRVIKRGRSPAKLEVLLELLVQDEPLPERCRPHKLSGNYDQLWECHIEPDWLLIYSVAEDFIDLVRTGSHADLFK